MIDHALAKAQMPNPYRKQPGAVLLWGKVSARHPAEGTVDVVLDHGSILPHVPVVPQLVGTLTGSSYLPKTDPVQPQQTPQGPYGLPTPNPDPTANDLYAVVAWLEGSGRQPLVVGFLPPTTPPPAWLPQQPGWAVRRHESGQWEAIDPDGNLTLGWPDGSTLTVTTGSGPAVPPTDINPAWPPANGSDVQVHLQLAGGATIDVVGNTITLNGGTAGIARVGDSVQVDVNGTTYTGSIISGSDTVKSG
ncbi:hypothetical protein [Sulfobacillus harzensis]|uniref:Gp5/Type VI secretion system Vgr protein OB-fold domain-containing protein n=1 Tax=Sulfobacillus harzensis TaxID=2729629 RepID=A0A7Y0Q0Z9_9FIRM|nr:hypothetical protein [Sulfobacillus harzensis]NMP20780.1 hypothetical protein [Sulfobacillus harzensis]